MNYALNSFDEHYAQIHLNRIVGPGRARTYERRSDADRRSTPPFIRRVLRFAGVWKVTVCGNVVCIRTICYCGLPWETIARETARAAAELFDDCTLVQKVSNEDFIALFRYPFSAERLAA